MRTEVFLCCWSLLIICCASQSAIRKGRQAKGSKKERGGRGRRKGPATTVQNPMNLLFIMFDDLRPELSIYGKDYITSPNFERLAQKSVVFDNAYCQVAVCNPSRDSLLTGLRPDTIGSFGFQTSYKPHLILPTRLKRSGYMTASYGKTMHHESADPEVWNYYQPCTPIDWYQYQNYERDHMNSSLTPDKYKPEEEFPDYNIATQVVKTMKQFHAEKQLFMISVGFKMPHLSMHVPYKYYDMYRSRADAWNLTEQERTYPPTTPSVSHRCCGDTQFKYMNQEGTLPSKRFQKLPWTTTYAPADMSKELMWGYAAMITFVDKQLGRVLDAVDELDLWSNLTIVLTADHGFHNGEKGVWEKWSLFDESTHVPLLIHHPLSPFKGRHYKHPVELIDIFPTLNDLLGARFNETEVYVGPPRSLYVRKQVPFQGKTLAPVILGNNYRAVLRGVPVRARQNRTDRKMPTLARTFALSQLYRCTNAENAFSDWRVNTTLSSRRLSVWYECDMFKYDASTHADEIAVMGYSLRTLEYRYTAWYQLIRPYNVPDWSKPLIAEELYDHRDDYLGDLGHKELVNLAGDQPNQETLVRHRKTVEYILKNVIQYYNDTLAPYQRHIGWGNKKQIKSKKASL